MERYKYLDSNIDEIQSIVNSMIGNRNALTNYFNQEITKDFDLYYTEKTSILRKKIGDYFRLFVISTDKNDLLSVLSVLPSNRYVINFPSKDTIFRYTNVLNEAGFSFCKVYKRMYNTKIKKRGSLEKIVYATSDDIVEISTLLNNSFVSYLDYLPIDTELLTLIKNKNIVINKNNNKILGVLIFEIQGKKVYFRAWVDHSSNSLKLLFDTYTIMKVNNYNYAYFWVDSNNINVIKIHNILGSKFDGLNDFIFTKNI